MTIVSKKTPLAPTHSESVDIRQSKSSLSVTPVVRLPEEPAHPSQHVVQFYETDDFLLEVVSSFIGAGLGAGDVCIVVATPTHRAGLEQRLRDNGFDTLLIQERGRCFILDAAETLAQFMCEDLPVPERFTQVIGSLIERAAKDGRPVRIFGEMVALLWKAEKRAAAVHLEELWNQLATTITPSFTLLCAYEMPDFAGDEYQASFSDICQQHSQVQPDENYTLLESLDEQLRAIALLQQKAASLEAEIVERKAAEERFRLLAKQAPIMIWQSDPTGSVIYVNTAWCVFTGLSEQESLEAGWISAIHPEEQEAASTHWMTALSSLTPYHAQLRLQHADGIHRSVQVDGTACRDAEGAFIGYIGTMVDLTAHKELEQQREAFTSLVTHELRTPLTALQGNIQLAQRWLTRLLSQQEQLGTQQQHTLEEVLTMLGRSQQQLRVQNRLINDLLDVSRVQEDKLELSLAPCDLLGLVYETVQDYQAANPSRLITLTFPEQDLLPVYADGDRLRQVLGNYLTNALKFSPDSQPIEVGVMLEATSLRVSVTDHGPGLSLTQQQHLWKRLDQGPRTPLQRGARVGLGLGLYICQQLIERQQGQVGVESTEGQGATFWFTLPVLSSLSSLPPEKQ